MVAMTTLTMVRGKDHRAIHDFVWRWEEGGTSKGGSSVFLVVGRE